MQRRAWVAKKWIAKERERDCGVMPSASYPLSVTRLGFHTSAAATVTDRVQPSLSLTLFMAKRPNPFRSDTPVAGVKHTIAQPRGGRQQATNSDLDVGTGHASHAILFWFGHQSSRTRKSTSSL